MKISLVLFFAALRGVIAWDEDPRCDRLLLQRAKDPSVSDSFLLDSKGNAHSEHELLPKDTLTENLAKKATKGSFIEKTQRLRGNERHGRYLDDDLLLHFRLRMYWEKKYCWQNEWREREWCMQCTSDECDVDDFLEIRKCDEDERQRFIYERVSGSGGGKIKPLTEPELCWERVSGNTCQLRPCDADEDDQIFKGFDYDDEFELHPDAKPDKCMAIHHHPKSEEVVRAVDCDSARDDKISYWFADQQSNLLYGGTDYCRDKPGGCDVCEGDCDNDSECAGDLRCSDRDSSEEDEVPGCDGGEYDSTSRDYCYDPDWRRKM